MPRNNQTGPMGEGPMTGRGRGFCNAADPAYGTRGPGAEGFGRAMGRRRGFERGFGSGSGGFSGRRLARRRPADTEEYASQDLAAEFETLKMQAESITSALDSINRRMQELEKTHD